MTPSVDKGMTHIEETQMRASCVDKALHFHSHHGVAPEEIVETAKKFWDFIK